MSLFKAVKSGDLYAVNGWLEKAGEQEYNLKMCVNIQDDMGNTPLHYAAFGGHPIIVSTLIESGAKVDVINCYAENPICFAVDGGHLHIIDILLTKYADASRRAATRMAIIRSIRVGNLVVLDGLLARGVLIGGNTSLHIAAENGHADVAERLIQVGVPVDLRDSANYTPLHMAAQKGYLSVARKLIKYGAKIDASTRWGETPLSFAVRGSHREMIDLLLLCGADPGLLPIINRSHIDSLKERQEALFSKYWYPRIHGEFPPGVQSVATALKVGTYELMMRGGPEVMRSLPWLLWADVMRHIPGHELYR